MRKFALLLLVAPLALAACGSSHRASAIDEVRTAITKTANTSGFHLTAKYAGTNVRTNFKGDSENGSGLVRMSFSAQPHGEAVLTPTAIYIREFGYLLPRNGHWTHIALRQLRRSGWTEYVPSFIPYTPVSLGRVRSAVEIAPGHFRVSLAGTLHRAQIWVAANGYVTRLRYPQGGFTEMVTFSRFGERLHLTIPKKLEVRA